MSVDVAVIREALKTATRGPWRWDQVGHIPELTGRDGEPGVYEYDTEVLMFEHDHGCGCRRDCMAEVTLAPADADLIVLLRNNTEALLDELERAQAASEGVDMLLAQAERRGAVNALRGAAERYSGRGHDDYDVIQADLFDFADQIENGESL